VDGLNHGFILANRYATGSPDVSCDTIHA
jgi:hypothetical protein